MLRFAFVLAAATIIVSGVWAEEARDAAGDAAAATTTTTQPERGYRLRGEPASLPTGLSGFGSPGEPPKGERTGPTPPPGH